ncbi:MAG: zinc ribbon domain-containing protein [Acidobacteriota bacterium]
MFCVRCGRQVEPGDRFCPGCGSSASGPVPLMPSEGRIAGHVRLLGILWIAVSAFRLLPGMVLLSIFRHGFPFPGGEGVPDFIPGLLQTIGVFFIVGSVLGILAGVGLLARQSWARLVALILGGLSLVDMPFGTALGIYTLWTLLPAQSEQEYRRMSAQGAA